MTKWEVRYGWQMSAEDVALMPSGSQVGHSEGRTFRSRWNAARFARRTLKKPGFNFAHIDRLAPRG